MTPARRISVTSRKCNSVNATWPSRHTTSSRAEQMGWVCHLPGVSASTSHADEERIEQCSGYGVAFCNECWLEIIHIIDVMLADSFVQFISSVFNRVHVRRLCRPIHNEQVAGLRNSWLCLLCEVSVIALKDSQIRVVLKNRRNDRSQYLNNVDISGSLYSESKQGSTVLMTESTSNMYDSSSICVIQDCPYIGISFSRTTSDSISPISKGDNPVFIGEQC